MFFARIVQVTCALGAIMGSAIVLKQAERHEIVERATRTSARRATISQGVSLCGSDASFYLQSVSSNPTYDGLYLAGNYELGFQPDINQAIKWSLDSSCNLVQTGTTSIMYIPDHYTTSPIVVYYEPRENLGYFNDQPLACVAYSGEMDVRCDAGLGRTNLEVSSYDESEEDNEDDDTNYSAYYELYITSAEPNDDGYVAITFKRVPV